MFSYLSFYEAVLKRFYITFIFIVHALDINWEKLGDSWLNQAILVIAQKNWTIYEIVNLNMVLSLSLFYSYFGIKIETVKSLCVGHILSEKPRH